jgi:4-hydroxybenzoate polyprenyltransferase
MKRLARILLVTSIVFALLLVLAGIASQELRASFWIGVVWLVGVMLFNVWVGAQRPKKKCPQCAETVLPAANVCRFCGFQF